MALNIYEKTSGHLVASGERTVATFPSGLLRVDQKYYGANTNAATHRAMLKVGNELPDGNSNPAIDGLYIYPEAQEIKRPDGFTEYVVSAYGRTTKSLQNIRLQQERIIASSTLSYNVWKFTGAICVMQGEAVSVSDLGLNDNMIRPFDFVFSDNTELDFLSLEEIAIVTPSQNLQAVQVNIGEKTFTAIQQGPTRRQYRVEMTLDGITLARSATFWINDPAIRLIEQRNFGEFTEIEITSERENAETTII